MLIDITLDMPAFSVNAYYYRDRRHKTAEARAWEAEFQRQLEDYKILHDFAHRLKDGATVAIEIVVEYPPHVFYNKAGHVSSKTFDVTNVEKPIVDQIFNFMGANDKVITKLVSTKKPGPKAQLKIRLEINGL